MSAAEQRLFDMAKTILESKDDLERRLLMNVLLASALAAARAEDEQVERGSPPERGHVGKVDPMDPTFCGNEFCWCCQ